MVGDLGVPDWMVLVSQAGGQEQVVVGDLGVPDQRISEGQMAGQVVVGDQGVPGLLPPDSTSSCRGL